MHRLSVAQLGKDYEEIAISHQAHRAQHAKPEGEVDMEQSVAELCFSISVSVLATSSSLSLSWCECLRWHFLLPFSI